ncbi:hypothetical protein [Nocardia barduliensis]|uniref:hypothetical protein n=1 Tax=Nocardia barduliensis TaxID=2736643 RepID=UPI001574E02C|nr:hypothetical protein [Nocardia barduliensis]
MIEAVGATDLNALHPPVGDQRENLVSADVSSVAASTVTHSETSSSMLESAASAWAGAPLLDRQRDTQLDGTSDDQLAGLLRRFSSTDPVSGLVSNKISLCRM